MQVAMLDLTCLLFAQAAGGAAAPAPAGGAEAPPGLGASLQPLIMFGIPLLLAWFILLRPAQKQEKERKKAIYTLKKGDEVTFSGGMLGTVQSIKEKVPGTAGDNDEVTVKSLEAKLRILRSSIYAITPADADATARETASA